MASRCVRLAGERVGIGAGHLVIERSSAGEAQIAFSVGVRARVQSMPWASATGGRAITASGEGWQYGAASCLPRIGIMARRHRREKPCCAGRPAG